MNLYNSVHVASSFLHIRNQIVRAILKYVCARLKKRDAIIERNTNLKQYPGNENEHEGVKHLTASSLLPKTPNANEAPIINFKIMKPTVYLRLEKFNTFQK